MSKRNLTYVLKEMKEIGFPIKYDKTCRSYFYTQKGQLVAKLFVNDAQILSRQELNDIVTTDLNNLCFSETAIFEPCG